MIGQDAAIRRDFINALPIYLERRDSGGRMARFYSIRIERTLFDEWSVIYGWGRIGSSGQHREQWLPSWMVACKAVDRQLAAKMRRGYCVKSAIPKRHISTQERPDG